MAIDPTTLLKYQRRWGNTYLAQLTRRDAYDPSTNNTIDEDALETAIDQAKQQVQTKIGPVEDDHWGVIEVVPYFLNAPHEEFPFERMKYTIDNLKKSPTVAASSGLEKDAEGDRRRFDGDDYKDLENTQRNTQGRRGTF